jgi:hypothetical protein
LSRGSALMHGESTLFIATMTGILYFMETDWETPSISGRRWPSLRSQTAALLAKAYTPNATRHAVENAEAVAAAEVVAVLVVPDRFGRARLQQASWRLGPRPSLRAATAVSAAARNKGVDRSPPQLADDSRNALQNEGRRVSRLAKDRQPRLVEGRTGCPAPPEGPLAKRCRKRPQLKCGQLEGPLTVVGAVR